MHWNYQLFCIFKLVFKFWRLTYRFISIALLQNSLIFLWLQSNVFKYNYQLFNISWNCILNSIVCEFKKYIFLLFNYCKIQHNNNLGNSQLCLLKFNVYILWHYSEFSCIQMPFGVCFIFYFRCFLVMVVCCIILGMCIIKTEKKLHFN